MLRNAKTWARNRNFVEGVLISLQNSTDEDGNVVVVDSSACQVNFNSFWDSIDSLDLAMVLETYKAARELKGQGSGTDAGFWFNNFSNYQMLVVSGFEMYNECSLDYYMVGVGNAVQNPSGLTNLGTNLAFRVYSSGDTTLTDLASAITTYTSSTTDANLMLLGKQAGNLARIVLSVEIPTTTDNSIAYY